MIPYRSWLVCLIALGCENDPSDPSRTFLRGQWGTAGENPAQLIALNVAAELSFPCGSVVTSSPVPLGPDNSFDFIGRYNGSGARVSGPPIRARVRGRWLDETVALDVDVAHDGEPPFSYVLQSGVDPDFEDQPFFCPQ